MSFEIWPEIISGVVGIALSGVAGHLQHRRDVPRENITISHATCSFCSRDAIGHDPNTGTYLCKDCLPGYEEAQAQPKPSPSPKPMPQVQQRQAQRDLHDEQTVRSNRRGVEYQTQYAHSMEELLTNVSQQAEDEYLDEEEEEEDEYYDDGEACPHGLDIGQCRKCYFEEQRHQVQAEQATRRQPAAQRQRPTQRGAQPPRPAGQSQRPGPQRQQPVQPQRRSAQRPQRGAQPQRPAVQPQQVQRPAQRRRGGAEWQ